MKPTQSIKRGDIVRSILNPHYTYRVLAIGPKRAIISTTDGCYFRCYCSPSVLAHV